MPEPRRPQGGGDPWQRARAKPVQEEQRLYGLNAVRAAFAARPDDLRKLWLAESRVHALRDIVAWCVKQRIGYRVLPEDELSKVAASSHHEGVVAAMRRHREPRLAEWLGALPAGPVLALWLDGVGNPHNLGALLRSAAHFGAGALLLGQGDPLGVSGAAARVAEGGAEAVPLVRLPEVAEAIPALQQAGFGLVASVVRGGDPLFGAELPARTVLVLGAEGEGVDPALAAACQQRIGIPGTGAVESLNVSVAGAVLMAEWYRRSRTP